MSASATQEAGREWFGTVRHTPSSNFTALSFSSAMQRQWADEPAAADHSRSLRRTGSTKPEAALACFGPTGAGTAAGAAACTLRLPRVCLSRPSKSDGKCLLLVGLPQATYHAFQRTACRWHLT